MSNKIFDSNDIQTPAEVIMYMIDEAIRRTDINAAGEFGMGELDGIKQIWYHENLLKRINEYIDRVKSGQA